MSSQPVMRKEINRLNEIDKILIGARLEFVTYRQTRSSGLAVAPSGRLHEVDLNVVLGLSTRIVDITWDRSDLVEGLAVAFPEAVVKNDDSVFLDVSESVEWQPYIRKNVVGISLGWYISEADCPESLWTLRLSFGPNASVEIALGELGPDGNPTYHPDSIVVLFDEYMARSYRPTGATGNSLAEG